MENEVFALHYEGKLLRHAPGMRIGAVYCDKRSASWRKTTLVNDWKKYHPNLDHTKLEVVRYLPAEVRNA